MEYEKCNKCGFEFVYLENYRIQKDGKSYTLKCGLKPWMECNNYIEYKRRKTIEEITKN